MHFSSRQAYDYFNFLHIQTFTTKYNFIFQENLICYIILHLFNTFLKVGTNSIVLWYEINMRYFWFCQYYLTHFIRTRIMQRERYDHSRAFFGLPEEARRWRCRFFCWPSNSYNISRS